jgi:hypothetical protein
MNVYLLQLITVTGARRRVSIKADSMDEINAIINNPRERAWHNINLRDTVSKITQVY